MEIEASQTYRLLCELGATANYMGFFYTAHAVHLCVREPKRLQLVTKWVYPEVAKAFDTNWKAVERNIRTVNAIIWKKGRPLLERSAGGTLESRPTPAQLLSILTCSLISRQAEASTFCEPIIQSAFSEELPRIANSGSAKDSCHGQYQLLP